jgi:riboflavin synthase alpha subunit
MTVGEGIAIAGLCVSVMLIVCALILATLWRDAWERARSNTELTPPPKPGQSRRRKP